MAVWLEGRGDVMAGLLAVVEATAGNVHCIDGSLSCNLLAVVGAMGCCVGTTGGLACWLSGGCLKL
jgi:hypothetical protein